VFFTMMMMMTMMMIRSHDFMYRSRYPNSDVYFFALQFAPNGAEEPQRMG
jgi:hypothetical protein